MAVAVLSSATSTISNHFLMPSRQNINVNDNAGSSSSPSPVPGEPGSSPKTFIRFLTRRNKQLPTVADEAAPIANGVNGKQKATVDDVPKEKLTVFQRLRRGRESITP